MEKDLMPELARIYREERDGFLEATLTAWSSKVFPTSKSNNNRTYAVDTFNNE